MALDAHEVSRRPCSKLFVNILWRSQLYTKTRWPFLWDEFGKHVTIRSISRALVSMGWSKKVARQIAKERNEYSRDFYLHNLSAFRSYHLVFVDESGCDKRAGFRRTGWSLSVFYRSKYSSFTGIDAIRSYLHMLKMGLYCDGYSKALPTPMFSRISSNNFYNTATDGRSQSLLSSWITLLFIVQWRSSSCAQIPALSLCISHLIHRI